MSLEDTIRAYERDNLPELKDIVDDILDAEDIRFMNLLLALLVKKNLWLSYVHIWRMSREENGLAGFNLSFLTTPDKQSKLEPLMDFAFNQKTVADGYRAQGPRYDAENLAIAAGDNMLALGLRFNNNDVLSKAESLGVKLTPDTYYELDKNPRIYGAMKARMQKSFKPADLVKDTYGEYSPTDKRFCKWNSEGQYGPLEFEDIPVALVKIHKIVEIPLLKIGFEENEFHPDLLRERPEPVFEVKRISVIESNNKQPGEKFFTFDFPVQWFKQCNEHLANLSVADRFKICGYTWNGDKIVNMWLLQKFDEWWDYIGEKISTDYEGHYFPLFFNIREILRECKRDDFYKYLNEEAAPAFTNGMDTMLHKCAIIGSTDDLVSAYEEVMMLAPEEAFSREMYEEATTRFVKDLFRIIGECPPFPADCVVYRGVKDKYFMTEGGKDYVNSAFQSTSYDYDSALNFANLKKGCCVKKILVPKGARGLWMEPITQVANEHEILFQPGLSFKILDDRQGPVHLAGSDENFDQAVCSGDRKKMNFTTLQLLKKPAIPPRPQKDESQKFGDDLWEKLAALQKLTLEGKAPSGGNKKPIVFEED